MRDYDVRKPTVIDHVGGLIFSAEVRSHSVITDQPHGAGGTDIAPTPVELLGAALGSCVALYVYRFCAARDLPREGLRVEIDQHNETDPPRVGWFTVRVIMPEELGERYLALLERVVKTCPVHNTLVRAAPIETEILMPAGVR